MTRSARTFITGRGHVPLPDARRWALEQVESCEVNVAERLTELQATGRAQTDREATEAYFTLHRRHEALITAVVGLRDCYQRNANLHPRLGSGDEPFKHAAWKNRADDLTRLLDGLT